MLSETFFIVDFPALLIVILASILCALMGSFLVLRKEAVMVDALSHSVLPGIVMGVYLSGSFSILYVMGGATLSCLIAVLGVYALQRYARIEQGAAIGTVFTTMFALGVVFLETYIGGRVHLDTQHVLYGALELTYWANPFEWDSMPMQIKTLSVMLVITLAFMIVFFKELRVSTFDPLYAELQGQYVTALHLIQILLTALIAVSCFEATGSILVISLFVCPAASARMLCDRMETQMWLSAIIGIFCAITGYFCAGFLPLALGFEHSINAAAMIAVICGIFLVLSMLFSPAYGVITQKKKLFN
ncbi:MAG: metal ABC transporter permease [Alphaproteobacteria bacterium]|nr:metal ABC transporter permease [Alphaproteobacteria bacterium]